MKVLKLEENQSHINPNLLFTMFAAFGFFRTPPTRIQFLQKFKDYDYQILCDHLDFLINQKLILLYDDKLKVQTDLLMLNNGFSLLNNKKIIKSSIKDSVDAVDLWFDEKRFAFFNSNIISVKSLDYQKALLHFSESLIEFSTSIESDEADMLVAINHQIFPIMMQKSRK